MNIGPKLEISDWPNQTWEGIQRWEVLSKLSVPPGQTTEARFLLQEEKWDGTFLMRSDITGILSIHIMKSANMKPVMSFDEDICNMMTLAIDNGLNIHGLEVDGNMVSYTTRGHLKFRYGVQQHLHISMKQEEDDTEEDYMRQSEHESFEHDGDDSARMEYVDTQQRNRYGKQDDCAIDLQFDHWNNCQLESNDRYGREVYYHERPTRRCYCVLL